MSWGMIATWRMAMESAVEAASELASGRSADDAAERAIMRIENEMTLSSVGYGGLPNRAGEVELDAAMMDGDTFAFGAVGAIKRFKNPIAIARALSQRRYNNFLCASGAERYARKQGFVPENLLSEAAAERWRMHVRQHEAQAHRADTDPPGQSNEALQPYQGHDTVGFVCLDQRGKMIAATSTSGLFLKDEGRIGDSPLPGSGYYVDSEVGGAVATGLGEDIAKGCICYETVRLLRDGAAPGEAAERALRQWHDLLLKRSGQIGNISLVCLTRAGQWGVATNLTKPEVFSFVVASDEHETAVFLAYREDGKTVVLPASAEWIARHPIN